MDDWIDHLRHAERRLSDSRLHPRDEAATDVEAAKVHTAIAQLLYAAQHGQAVVGGIR
jgi:hypothetical protein